MPVTDSKNTTGNHDISHRQRRIQSIIRSGKSSSDIQQILDRDDIRRKDLANKTGLNEESALINLLLDFDESEVNEKIDIFARELSEYFISEDAKEIYQIIFKFINQQSLVQSISSFYDFAAYLDRLYFVAQLNSVTVKNTPEQIKEKKQFETIEIQEVFKAMANLLRDNPTEDLKNIIRMIEYLKSDSSNVLLEITKISPLIHSSEDLNKVRIFFEDLKIMNSRIIENFFGDTLENRELKFVDSRSKEEYYKETPSLSEYYSLIDSSEKLGSFLSSLEIINKFTPSFVNAFQRNILKNLFKNSTESQILEIPKVLSSLTDLIDSTFKSKPDSESKSWIFEDLIYYLNFDEDIKDLDGLIQKTTLACKLFEELYISNKNGKIHLYPGTTSDFFYQRNSFIKAFQLVKENPEKLDLLASIFKPYDNSNESDFDGLRSRFVLIHELSEIETSIKDINDFKIVVEYLKTNPEPIFLSDIFNIYTKNNFSKDVNWVEAISLLNSIQRFKPVNPGLFQNILNYYHKETRIEKIELFKILLKLNIHPEFIDEVYVSNNKTVLDILRKDNGDLAEGLEQFGVYYLKAQYIIFCIDKMKNEGFNFDLVTPFINEALEDINLREFALLHLSDFIVNNVLAKFDRNTFETLSQKINKFDDCLSLINKSNYSLFPFNDYLFIDNMNNHYWYSHFPVLFESLRAAFFSKLSNNEDLADYFFYKIKDFADEIWIESGVKSIVKHISIRNKFLDAVNLHNVSWKDKPWVESINNHIADLNYSDSNVEDDLWDTTYTDDSADNPTGIVLSNSESKKYNFIQNERGLIQNKFESHRNKITKHQIEVSGYLLDILEGREPGKQILDLEIEVSELLQRIEKIRMIVFSAHQYFLNAVRKSSIISQEEKEILLYPESSKIHMTPLLHNVYALVCRYISQEVLGDLTNLDQMDAAIKKLDEGVIDGCYEKYLEVYQYDIPNYDKLYRELDEIRENGRTPLEVYLGRDGIYAFIGRRAADIARLRKLGREGRVKLKEEGKIIHIKPKYLVYPRLYRDSLPENIKREYLEQESIVPSSDPIFYDTGYTGSIPEQILKYMGYSEDEVNQRIRLLSATNDRRRVRDIPDSERDNIVKKIEYNSKSEHTSAGLYQDPKTGKIMPVAEPTSPEEQLAYAFVRQAISRHYYFKEMSRTK